MSAKKNLKQQEGETKLKCPDCDCEMSLPTDTEIGEIVNCPCCGLEFEVKDNKIGCQKIEPLTLEAEDWGE